MTHVTCRLTAKNRDQFRNPTLGNRVWATFTFLQLGLHCETEEVWQRGTARIRPPPAAAAAIDRYLLPAGPTAVKADVKNVEISIKTPKNVNRDIIKSAFSLCNSAVNMVLPAAGSGGFKLEGLVGHWPRGPPLLCWFQLPQAYFRNPWASPEGGGSNVYVMQQSVF